VRQIHTPPVTVIERNGAGRKEISCLLEVSGPSAPESEVLSRVVGIPEVEAPAEIQEKTFASAAWL
jgi:hypothetical protein